MVNFRRLLACGVVAAGVVGTSLESGAASRSLDPARTMYLSFSMPVQLPGVELPPGVYVFELADPAHARDLVRVSSQDRRKVYLTAPTKVVSRPVNSDTSLTISFGEPPRDGPRPITVWWPAGESTGRQFIYRSGDLAI